jgi:anti-sigma factor RsiW
MPHPSDEELVALRDKELTESRRDEVSAHLEACERCREHLARIEEDLRRFRQQDPATYSMDVIPPSERLAELERSLRVWSSGHVRGPDETREPAAFPPPDMTAVLRERLGAEGIGEALATIRAAGSDRERLSKTLKALLLTRLKEPEATDLTNRVLEAWDRHRASDSSRPSP